MKDDVRFTESSGNVFADLGLDDADELMAKAKLASKIADAILERDLSYEEAATRLAGATQSDIVNLCYGRINQLSLEQLDAWAAKTETWN